MAHAHRSRYFRSRGSFDQNIGVAGVVYVLQNDGVKYLKIGASTRSGHVRARELDDDARTAVPIGYRCVFERPVADCGTAERIVHARLRAFRRGRHGVARDGRAWGQEFFEVNLLEARRVIEEVCESVDEDVAVQLAQKAEASRQREWVDPAPVSERPGDEFHGISGAWRPPEPRRRGPGVAALTGALIVVLLGLLVLDRSATRAPVQLRAPSNGQQPAGVQGTFARGPGPTESSLVAAPEPARRLTESFPPGGSALYFAGRPDGLQRGGSLRLYAPATSVQRYEALVMRMPQDEVFAQAFLEPNDVVDIVLPRGRFRLAYASGVEWFGTRKMFGPGHDAVQIGNEFEIRDGVPILRVELPAP